MKSREVFHTDASFHEELARMSGNSFVLSALHQQNRLRRLIEYQGYRDVGRVHTWCREHVAITDALLRGANRKASARLTLHLTNAAEALMMTRDYRAQPLAAAQRKTHQCRCDVRYISATPSASACRPYQ